MRTRTSTITFPTSIIGRVVFALIAVTLAVVGLFFLVFALAAVAVIVTGIAIRLWWIRRKLVAQQNSDVIEGSYSVESAQLLTVDPDAAAGDEHIAPTQKQQ